MASEQNHQELFSQGERLPPSDLEAEGIVLGELLTTSESFDRVASILEPESFWPTANRQVFALIKELHQKGHLVDLTSVAGLAKDKGKLDAIGGSPYLVQLATSQPAPGPYLEQHAERIRELWRRRQAILQAKQIVAEGYGDVGDGQAWLESIEQTYSSLAHEYSARQVFPIGELAFAEVIRLNEASATGKTSGISTGLKKLDHLITGLHRGDLYIVAGRPGMGKTAFVTTMLMNVASQKDDGQKRYASILFSLEQPKEQIALRVLCAESGASFQRVRRQQFHHEDMKRLNDYVQNLGVVPFYIDDKPAITLMELRSEVRKLKRALAHGTAAVDAEDLVVVGVDYIQLMEADKLIRQRGTREQEVSSFTQGLKRIAKEENVAVVALSQLNRKVEDRADKHPTLPDLRESGAIEQDADTILFLYREGYYKRGSDDKRCDIDVAKQRNGPVGTMQAIFEGETMTFRSMTDDEAMSGENLDDEENPDGY